MDLERLYRGLGCTCCRCAKRPGGVWYSINGNQRNCIGRERESCNSIRPWGHNLERNRLGIHSKPKHRYWLLGRKHDWVPSDHSISDN